MSQQVITLSTPIEDEVLSGTYITRNKDSADPVASGSFAQGSNFETYKSAKETNPIAKLEAVSSEAFEALKNLGKQLETSDLSIEEIDFQIEGANLTILSHRPFHPESPSAKLQLTLDFVKEGLTPKSSIFNIFSPESVKEQLRPKFEESELASSQEKIFAHGQASNQFVGSGSLAFSADKLREPSDDGYIFIQKTFAPNDIQKLKLCKGVILSEPTVDPSIAALASQLEIPIIFGCTEAKIDIKKQTFTAGENSLAEGDPVSIDGKSGSIYAAKISVVRPSFNGIPGIAQILKFSDEARAQKLPIYVVQDAPEVDLAAMGADGVGLYKAEQPYLGEKSAMIQKFLFPEDDEEKESSIAELEDSLTGDFTSIIEACGASPAMIQFFDSPIQGYLPDLNEIKEELAAMKEDADEEEKKDKEAQLAKYSAFQQKNPLIGCRGMRVYEAFPKLLEVQLKAIINAAVSVVEKGGDPHAYAILPFVCMDSEVAGIRGMIEKLSAPIFKEREVKATVKVGATIGVARGCIVAGKIAENVDCLIFDTDLLQQTSFGLSAEVRDRIVSDYLAMGLFKSSPFDSIDVDGVGKLIDFAIRGAKAKNSTILVGIAGDACADPKSIEFCHRIGVSFLATKQSLLDYARLYVGREVSK